MGTLTVEVTLMVYLFEISHPQVRYPWLIQKGENAKKVKEYNKRIGRLANAG